MSFSLPGREQETVWVSHGGMETGDYRLVPIDVLDLAETDGQSLEFVLGEKRFVHVIVQLTPQA